MLINTHPLLLSLDPPPSLLASSPAGTSQSLGNAPAVPPRDASAAVAMPWVEMIALAVMALLSIAVLRVRFSDAPPDSPQVRRDSSRESPLAEEIPMEVPRPSLLFRRSHHEKMHDQHYLSLMLEAEQKSPSPPRAREDGDEAQPPRA